MDIPESILRRIPNKYLHSKEHVLADDLSRMMKEQKRFAAYLGIAMLYRESDLRALARRVLEKEDLPAANRGKYFFAAVSGMAKKPGSRLKKSRRRPIKRKVGAPRKRRTKTSPKNHAA